MRKWDFTPYMKRTIRWDKLYPLGDWRCKIYSISAINEKIPEALFVLAEGLLPAILPREAVTPSRYGLAFMIVHEALDGNYLLVSWWEGQNMLCHKVYASTLEAPCRFEDFSSTGIIACVWELEVIYFEKKAWTETVLMDPDRSGFERYLSLHYSGEI